MTTESTINLKQTILTFWSYFKEILRKWYWYVIVGLIVGLFNYKTYKKIPINFQATGSFMATSNQGGGLSTMLQLAGQFGLGGKQEVDSEKMVELLPTRKIISKVLFDTVRINGRADLLANHYLDFYREDLKLSEEEADFLFMNAVVDSFGNTENRVLTKIYSTITRHQLSASASKNGIVYVNFLSESEEIAKWFVENVMHDLKNFYEDQVLFSQAESFTTLVARLDSVERAVQSADAQLLSWYNKNRENLRTGTLSPQQYIRKMELERNATIAGTTYTEALKNKELASLNSEIQKPVIQIIDKPIFPLPKIFPNLLKYIFYTFLLTVFPVSFLIIGNKLVRDALNS